jgi:predicted nucleic acid-binding protein
MYGSGLFERCASVDETRVRLLLADKLGAGEAEGLVQAQERGVAYFIADEKLARDLAVRQGLRSVGTLRLIARLSSEGHAEEVTVLVKRLKKDLGFRAQDALVSRAIAQASIPI